MRRSLVGSIFLMMLAMAGAVVAGPLEDSEAAAKIVREQRPLADSGSARAQYILGVGYYHGQGVPRDITQALGWFRKAAEQGLADAQYSLGLMYSKGEGLPQNFDWDLKPNVRLSMTSSTVAAGSW
jgi:TPR repeat protein